MKAPHPVWFVTYENTDVSDELAPMIVSAEYTDHVKGKSDELHLTIEDREGRWRGGWFPSKGDRLALKMGYDGQPLLDCGRFAVDQVELRGAPDTVAIGALAAPTTGAMRTAQNRAFEGTTLRELAERIARELELELLGDVGQVYLGRVTQTRESTVAFLRRLAEDYGYAFSIRPPQLVFYEIAKLASAPPTATVQRTDLMSYSLKGSTQATYVACEVTFLDPDTKTTRKVRVEAAEARQKLIIGGDAPPPTTTPIELPTRTLRVGSSGDDVRTWQTFLAGNGYDPGPIDGKYGGKTRAATIAFQRAAGIGADGVAGAETYRAAGETGYSTTDAGTRAEVSGQVLRKEIRVESIDQAELKARALLNDANRLRVTGSFSLEGNPMLVAGATIQLEGMGRLSGKFMIDTSTHRVSRSSGYTTDLEVSCV